MTDALGEALQLLQSTLSEKTVTLTERAQAEVQLRTENIGNILRRYRTVLEGCSAADLAVELLKETDKAMFVQAAKPLVGRLVETARSLKQTEEMCDNYETFDDFTLDSANALKDLRELDFVRRKKFRKSKKIDNKSRILLSAYNCHDKYLHSWK